MDDWDFGSNIDPTYADYGGLDIGIAPGSSGLDFNDYSAVVDDPSNYYSTNDPGSHGYDIGALTDPNQDWTFGNTSGGGLAVSQPQVISGSPNVGSPSADDLSKAAGSPDDKSWLEKIGGGAKSLISDDKGNIDISKLIKLGVGLGGLYGASRTGKPGTPTATKTTAQLQAELAQPNMSWTPQQSVWANKFFNESTPGLAAGDRKLVRAGEGGIKSIIPSRGYAGGGKVNDSLAELIAAYQDKTGEGSGVVPLLPLVPQSGLPEGRSKIRVHGGDRDFAEGGEVMMEEPAGPLSHGNFGLVTGEGDGQSDTVPINAAPGEYVFDTETVSMLGNGSNDAGADILDQWREFLREHKREANSDEIGPESKDPNDYLPKGVV